MKVKSYLKLVLFLRKGSFPVNLGAFSQYLFILQSSSLGKVINFPAGVTNN